jgi:hypothetical protein
LLLYIITYNSLLIQQRVYLFLCWLMLALVVLVKHHKNTSYGVYKMIF